MVVMKSLTALRVTAVLHAAVTCLQPVLAGSYLTGNSAAIQAHRTIGLGLAGPALLQLLAATIYWRAGGRGWPALLTVAVLLAEGVQAGAGFHRQFALHVPLGVAIVGTTVAFAGWTVRPAAHRRRTPRTAVVPG